jgi:hypothetical protein
MFGIFTDLTGIATGIIIGLPSAFGIFIGSMAIYFFGSWLSVSYNLVDIDLVQPGIQSWFEPGTNIAMLWQRSQLYLWVSPLIGISLAIGIAPLLRNPKIFLKAFSLNRLRKKSRLEPLSFNKLTLPFLLLGVGGSVVLFVLLVPNFVISNYYIIPLMIGLPFVSMLIAGRVIGETGVAGGNLGSLANLLYYTSGYPHADVWFAPNITIGSSGANVIQWFKVCELTETKSSSLIKLYWLLFPFAIAIGYLYVQIFWSIAPIPSGRYPGVAVFWPVQATTLSIWIKSGVSPLFKPDWILGSFIVGVVSYLGLGFLHFPIPFISIAAGTTIFIPIAVTYLIGSLVGPIFRLVFKRSKEWWDDNKTLIVAGILIGESISVVVSLAIAIIVNAIWIMPF